MFKEIVTNEKLVDLVVWLLNHSDSQYDAMTVGMNVGVERPFMFMQYLVVLDDLSIVNVVEGDDKLLISLNNDSDIVKAIKTIRDEIERTVPISKASMNALSLISGELPKGFVTEEQKDNIIDRIKQYSDIDEEDPMGAIVKMKLAKLDADGELENFIKFIEDLE